MEGHSTYLIGFSRCGTQYNHAHVVIGAVVIETDGVCEEGVCHALSSWIFIFKQRFNGSANIKSLTRTVASKADAVSVKHNG